MRFLFFGFLALAAFVLLGALLLGFAFKLVGLGLLALLVVGVVSFLLDRPRGPRSTLKLDREVPPNTMTFDRSHHGEHSPR